MLAQNPDSPGSLGIAISEAVEAAATSGGKYKYALGSVLNHVLMHQTVIGQEALKQMEMAGEYPDVVIGCVGGGSNFGGHQPALRPSEPTRANTPVCWPIEPAACPSLTKGPYAYDFGDSVGMAPMVKMYTLGHEFIPPPLHAGGLRYHGMGSIVCELWDQKLIECQAVPQLETFAAAITFARAEGSCPRQRRHMPWRA